MANRIKKGDQVKLIAGDNKGASGEVLKVVIGANNKPEKVYVSGINIKQKLVRKPTEPGAPAEKERVSKEYPVHISNVALVDNQTNRVAKIGFKEDGQGNKIRYFKKSGASV